MGLMRLPATGFTVLYCEIMQGGLAQAALSKLIWHRMAAARGDYITGATEVGYEQLSADRRGKGRQELLSTLPQRN